MDVINILERMSDDERDRMWKDFFKHGKKDETLPEFLKRWLDGKL